MKTFKNQTQEERNQVIANRNKSNLQKLKCIKNTRTGKVQRLPKNVCEQVIAENPDWHYTTKNCYYQTLNNAIPPASPTPGNGIARRRNREKRGLIKDKYESQLISKIEENPNYKKSLKNKPNYIYNKPRKRVYHESEINGKTVITTIIKKVPDTTKSRIKIIRVISNVSPAFVVVTKVIKHLLVKGVRTKAV